MELTTENKQTVFNFFKKNINLSNLFIDIWNLEHQKDPSLYLDSTAAIIGFRYSKDKYRAYVQKSNNKIYIYNHINKQSPKVIVFNDKNKVEIIKELNSFQNIKPTPYKFNIFIKDKLGSYYKELIEQYKQEETLNLRRIYKFVESKFNEIKNEIPYSDIDPYTTASDYEENTALQFKKAGNKPYWDKLKELDKYKGDLTVWHTKQEERDYFDVQNITKTMYNIDENFILSNVTSTNDNNQIPYIYESLYREKFINFIRKIIIKKQAIESIELIYDNDLAVKYNYR